MGPGGSMPHSHSPIIPILSRINPIPRIDTYLPLRSILILSSHLHLGLPEGIFRVGVPAQIFYFLNIVINETQGIKITYHGKVLK